MEKGFIGMNVDLGPVQEVGQLFLESGQVALASSLVGHLSIFPDQEDAQHLESLLMFVFQDVARHRPWEQVAVFLLHGTQLFEQAGLAAGADRDSDIGPPAGYHGYDRCARRGSVSGRVQRAAA